MLYTQKQVIQFVPSPDNLQTSTYEILNPIYMYGGAYSVFLHQLCLYL